jgi:large subunit ribosomal protein L22
MEGKAHSRYIRQSARKVRQVADLVRNKNVGPALNILHFSKQKASITVEKSIRSAVSNLMNLEGGARIHPEDLYIKTIYVNEGPTARRIRPGSMGRASIIRRRTCHLSVVVAEEKDKTITNNREK